jgi:hypothetical protein
LTTQSGGGDPEGLVGRHRREWGIVVHQVEILRRNRYFRYLRRSTSETETIAWEGNPACKTV